MPRIRPFKGVLAKALLGEDEAFGGDEGLIDFVRPKKKVKKKKPVKKNMGGMMKSKGSAKGGMMGGKMPRGMKKGGFPDLTGDGKVTQADVLKGRGVKPKRMKKGGAVKKKDPKGYSRGGAVKRRGVGIAKRGFGKAMR